jgi:hypothetical protein
MQPIVEPPLGSPKFQPRLASKKPAPGDSSKQVIIMGAVIQKDSGDLDLRNRTLWIFEDGYVSIV